MLQSLDVLVGFATIMLLFSMIVTALTQYITVMINSRGRQLRNGIMQLMQQLHPDFAEDSDFAKKIADTVLQHPLISRSSWFGKIAPGLKLGTVIQREELTRLLMDLASGQGAAKLDSAPASAGAVPVSVPVVVAAGGGTAAGLAAVSPAVPQTGPITLRLRKVLADLGISDPGATLDQVRAITLKLEQTAPELSNSARGTFAMLQAAESKFVARVDNWFDSCMDRVSEEFTQHARIVTACVAVFLAFCVQLDSIALVGRLSVDKGLRDKVVESAARVARAYETTTPPVVTPTPAPAASANSAGAPGIGTGQQTGTTPASQSNPDLKEAQRQYYALLSARGLIMLPWVNGWKSWWEQLRTLTPVPGILLTAVFLSLGAPFWYDALKNLLRFRSLLTQKDDVQRTERQTTQQLSGNAAAPPAANLPAPLATGTRAAVVPFTGEAGDLKAVG